MATPRGTLALAAALCSGVVALFPVPAAGQTFDLLGLGPAGFSSRAYGLSDDGTVASGGSPGNPAQGFWWTRSEGRRDVGVVLGLQFGSFSYGISGDGGTLVGQYGIDAYRWTIGSSSLDVLGRLPGYERASAQDASFDGSIVVGRSESFNGAVGQAFRWTESTGLVGLGFARADHFYSEAAAISRDGTTIVGHGRGSAGRNEAFVWRTDIGMVPLPGLDATNDARAFGVNFDGSIIVGDASPGPFEQVATMWVNGVPMSLGIAPGFIRSRAYGVNDAGTVIVGQLDGGGQTAAVWTPDRGMERLSDYLAFHGVQVPAGINLITATAVSADGMTFAGYTGGNGGPVEGFVASIPGPMSISALSFVYLYSFRRTRLK